MRKPPAQSFIFCASCRQEKQAAGSSSFDINGRISRTCADCIDHHGPRLQLVADLMLQRLERNRLAA